MNRHSLVRVYAAASFAIVLFGLVIMYYAEFAFKKDMNLLASTIQFFSFFTILSNTLVVLVLGAEIFGKRQSLTVRTCLLIYILLTGTVYFLVLRNVWDPRGMTLVGDIILHYVSPPAYAVYWAATMGDEKLRLSFFLKMTIFPLMYLAYSLARGMMIGTYPYPFLDVTSLGYGMVFVNVIIITAGIDAIALPAFVLNNRAWKRQQKQ